MSLKNLREGPVKSNIKDLSKHSGIKGPPPPAPKPLMKKHKEILAFVEIQKKLIILSLNINGDWDNQYGLGKIEAYDNIIDYINEIQPIKF